MLATLSKYILMKILLTEVHLFPTEIVSDPILDFVCNVSLLVAAPTPQDFLFITLFVTLFTKGKIALACTPPVLPHGALSVKHKKLIIYSKLA